MNQPPGRPGSNPQRPGSPVPGQAPGGRPGQPSPPPPAGYGRPQPPPQQYQQPQYQQPPAQPPPQYAGGAAPVLMPPARPRKSRASLRFLASSCIFSGWLTLIVCALLAVGSVIAGFGAQKASASATQYFPTQAPAAPVAPDPLRSAGDPDGVGFNEADEADAILNGLKRPGMGGGMGNGLNAMLPMLLSPTTYFLTGALTLLSGIIGCLLFLGFGQVCYVLLDLEEQTYNITQTLQLLSSRPGR